MKLYYMPGACSLATHIALIWAGAHYELERLAHADLGSEVYRRVNPKGAVPTLVLDDGTVITESLAVLQYIADCFPRESLGQNDLLGRAQLNAVLAGLVSDVHKAWAPVFVPERFVTKVEFREDAKKAAYAQLHRQYLLLESHMAGKEWSLFGRRTVADAYLYVMCRWKDKSPMPLSNYPALASFKTRLDNDAGVKRALMEEQ